jgi:hypothetical protein
VPARGVARSTFARGPAKDTVRAGNGLIGDHAAHLFSSCLDAVPDLMGDDSDIHQIFVKNAFFPDAAK